MNGGGPAGGAAEGATNRALPRGPNVYDFKERTLDEYVLDFANLLCEHYFEQLDQILLVTLQSTRPSEL